MDKPTIETPLGNNTRRGFARTILPYALSLGFLGAAGAGAHFYFTQQTERLHRTLQRVEGQNAYLHRQLILAQQQLQESDERISTQEVALVQKVREHEAALTKSVREREAALTDHAQKHEAELTGHAQKHEAALVQKVEEHNAALANQVRQVSNQAETIGSTLAVISTENQRLRSASASVEETARRYHDQAAASIAQLVDDANALVFEPEKHYALLTPAGLKVYPILGQADGAINQIRNPSSKKMPCRLYNIRDDLFSSSSSLVDVLLYLSHTAGGPPTTRGTIIVRPESAYAQIPELIDKDNEHAFISKLLDAARRDPPHRSFDIRKQLSSAVTNKAYVRFLTDTADDSVLVYLTHLEEPLEFEGETRQVSLAYESLALIGAETFCPKHKDTAVTAFQVVFDTIAAKQALGVGHYKPFTGNSFAEKATSLAALSRREFADIAPAALAAYKQDQK